MRGMRVGLIAAFLFSEVAKFAIGQNVVKPATVCEILSDLDLFSGKFVAVVGRRDCSWNVVDTHCYIVEDHCPRPFLEKGETWPNKIGWSGIKMDLVRRPSRYHGGQATPQNLTYACMICNRFKGSNIGSLDASGGVVRLFNPRPDRWEEHFRLSGAVIQPLTGTGEVTARLLRFNVAERVIER